MKTHDILQAGSPHRLQIFRAEAAKLGNMSHRRLLPTTWRTARYSKLSGDHGAACMGRNDNRPVITAFSESALPMRWVKNADDMIHLKHRGWFTDIEGLESTRGIVAALPHGKFLAGYVWKVNDEHVLFLDIHDTPEDAAHAANRHAKRFAEYTREDAERFEAMILAEFDVEEKTPALQRALLLRKHSHLGGRDRARDAVDALRKARETLTAATTDYEKAGS
jgi:hypothetical protein